MVQCASSVFLDTKRGIPITKADLHKACDLLSEAMSVEKTATLSLTELEQMAEQMGREFGRLLLSRRIQGDPRVNPGQEFIHPPCQQKLRIQNSAQQRIAKTSVGAIRYERPYGVCDRCNMSYAPLDEALGIPRLGLSILVRQRVCHTAVLAHSFEDAAELLRAQTAIDLSRKHVREVAEEEGACILSVQKEEMGAYQDHRLAIPPKPLAPELLVITCDGGRVQTRQENTDERWKENRVGAVYDSIPSPHKDAPLGKYDGPEANIKTYIATMESWEVFGWFLRIEAEKRGYESAKKKAFLGDGAKSIRELHDMHFQDATFILDWAHAVEHLSACGKAAFGEGTKKGAAWFETQKQVLWDGKIDDIIEELQKQSKRLGEPKKGDADSHPRVILNRNATSYFPHNKEAMNYPLFREEGLPIGSGVAEAAVKQFAIRMKGSEKFWNVSDRGANEMLALCALYNSEDGRWDAYWKKRSTPEGRR